MRKVVLASVRGSWYTHEVARTEKVPEEYWAREGAYCDRTEEACLVNPELKVLLDELRRQLAQVYGERLVQLVLFGSNARGDAATDSDIDVLVVLKGPVDCGDEIERTGPLLADLSLRHGRVVSCLFMDEERFCQRNGPLLRNVRREGIAL